MGVIAFFLGDMLPGRACLWSKVAADNDSEKCPSQLSMVNSCRLRVSRFPVDAPARQLSNQINKSKGWFI